MRFNLLAAAPLASRRYVFERVEIGLKYSLKPFQRRKYKNKISLVVHTKKLTTL